MKYVCAIDYIPNCPTCDGGYYSKLMFFNSIKEILTYALDNMNQYEVRDIYSTKRHKELDCIVGYECGRHAHTGVYFKHMGLHIRTQDDGHGKLVWVRQ